VDAAIALYRRHRARHLRFYQWASRWLTPLFQRDRVWPTRLRDIAIGRLGRLPVARNGAAALMAGVSLGPFRRLDIASMRNGTWR
jgi:2-polyprenyl-6-methoxyphenol hydroxylase-like FAD-dependent oxidoreductase